MLKLRRCACFFRQAIALSGLILYASLPPLFDSREDDRRGVSVFKASVPAEVRTQLMDAYGKSGLDKYVAPPLSFFRAPFSIFLVPNP